MLATLLLFVMSCVQPTSNQPANANAPSTAAAVPADLKPALDSIQANDIMQHTKVLSSDEYEGRGPGTKGEELSG